VLLKYGSFLRLVDFLIMRSDFLRSGIKQLKKARAAADAAAAPGSAAAGNPDGCSA